VNRLAALVLTVLVLAPAGLAAPVEATDGRLGQVSFHAPPSGIAYRPGTAPGSFWTLTTPEAQQTALELALVREINDARRQHGLKAFTYSVRLSAAASQHTREMGTQGYFEHESYDSTAFWKRIERWYPSKGWRYWAVGENLLYSTPDVTATEGVELWMNSPPHRANLLSRTWREIGISAVHFDSAPGEYDGGPVTIVTADFGNRH